MLGHSGLWHAKSTFDLSDRLLGRDQEAQYGAAVRLGDDFENRDHSLRILYRAYTCQGIYKQEAEATSLSVGSANAVRNLRGEGLLTPREDQVVNLVAEGTGNREVALQLGVKENTVKKSLLRIYDKLGVSNRVELVLYALTHRGPQSRPPAPQQGQTVRELPMDCVDPRQVALVGACNSIPETK